MTAAVVAAHIGAAGLPQESGFTLAFVVSAGELVVAFRARWRSRAGRAPARAARREASAAEAQPATG